MSNNYQNLQDEDEYVPTEVEQHHQQQQPIAAVEQKVTTTTTPQQQTIPSATNNQQQQQDMVLVTMLGQNGQPQLAYVPQSYLLAQQQYMQQQLQQQYMQQQYMQQQLAQQQQTQQLPPLPNVQQQQTPQQLPQYIQPTFPVPTTTIPSYNSNGQIPVTEESYVKVQGVDPILILLGNLFFPGLGHLIIGQQSKGAVYLATSIVTSTIIGVLCIFVVGFFLIPIQLVYNVLILIDGYCMADRIQKGYPVLKGECYFRMTSWGVSCVETKSPVFVHGSADEPAVWQLQCRQVDRQRGL